MTGVTSVVGVPSTHLVKYGKDPIVFLYRLLVGNQTPRNITEAFYRSDLLQLFVELNSVSGPYKFEIRDAKSPHRIMLLSLLQWIM